VYVERLARAVLLGAATFRITRLLNKDTILQEWRDDKLYPRFPYKGVVYVASDPKTDPLQPPSEGWLPIGTLPNGIPRLMHPNGTFIGNMWKCPWCLSVWVSIILTVRKNPYKWFVDCVAVAGFAMIARAGSGDTKD
jgi:hypothetical protein